MKWHMHDTLIQNQHLKLEEGLDKIQLKKNALPISNHSFVRKFKILGKKYMKGIPNGHFITRII